MKAIILLSGGLDSLACVAFHRNSGHDVSGLFVDYAQAARTKERTAVKRLSASLRLPLRTVDVQGVSVPRGFIPGRNALLLSVALTLVPSEPCFVAIGIHAGTPYADCTETFVGRVQAIYDLYRSGTALVSAPFLAWSKLDIWRYLKSVGYPIEASYSCELGLKQPCGKCLTCADLDILYAS